MSACVVIVSVSLIDRRCRCAVMQRVLQLQHPPIVGNELGFPGARPEYWSAEVLAVIQDTMTGVFHVEVEDWPSVHFGLEEMVECLGDGWKRLGEAA